MLRLPGIVDRRLSFVVLAGAVLCLAAFNLAFRQHVVTLQQWDESLYATTAWEMLRSGDLIGTTFVGKLDYYNSKPPLNVWLIALSFKLFGVNLIALRVPALLASFATVVVVIMWVRRMLGDAEALAAGLVLSTTFAFFHVHGGRQANTDALNTLFIVLIAVALWAARSRSWRLAWIGPLLAGIFLLRGMAILLPLTIIAIDELWTFGFRRRSRWAPTWAAVALFVLPVGAWLVARWRLDQWKFLSQLFWYDFVARTVSPIENHPGSVLFYFEVFVKRQPAWALAVLLILVLYPLSRASIRALVSAGDRTRLPARLLIVWGAAAILVPTIVRTKVDWYLHPFYPVFAIAAGALFVSAFRRGAAAPPLWRSWRLRVLVAVLFLAAGLAEGRIIWYSSTHRELADSSQGLLLAERDRLKGKVVYRRRLDRAEIFVLHALVGATHRLVPDRADFLRDAAAGDFFLAQGAFDDPHLMLVREQAGFGLYEKIR